MTWQLQPKSLRNSLKMLKARVRMKHLKLKSLKVKKHLKLKIRSLLGIPKRGLSCSMPSPKLLRPRPKPRPRPRLHLPRWRLRPKKGLIPRGRPRLHPRGRASKWKGLLQLTIWRPAVNMKRRWMLRVVRRFRRFQDMEVMLLLQHCLWPRGPELCKASVTPTSQRAASRRTPKLKWIRALGVQNAVGRRGAVQSAGVKLPSDGLCGCDLLIDDSDPDFWHWNGIVFVPIIVIVIVINNWPSQLISSWALDWEVLTLFAQMMVCAGGKV